MESDLGKLFIGGISWDTDENRLKEYFSSYGEVVEAVIMRDRTTGRARGFGFIVFADPCVAERVVLEKHMIDGRAVEAKKAVPRDDQHILNRSNSSIQGSPVSGRTKKIFVGGLASTVTENDFKIYFDQFGTITDVVVMYDHHTLRPRGFGFITYDTEEAVDRVLYKTFHELNGKMVEVKRAVPKEMSPASNRSPIGVGTNYGLHRTNSFLNSYAPGYNLGVRLDGRFSPLVGGRASAGAGPGAGVSQFGSPSYTMGMNLDPNMSPGFGGRSNFSTNLGYGQILDPYFNANTNAYNTPIGFGSGNSRSDSLLSSPSRNLWGNVGSNNARNGGAYLGSGIGNFGVFGNSGANWGSPSSAQGGGGTGPGAYITGTLGYGDGENSFGFGGGLLGRNNSSAMALESSFIASGGGREEPFGDLYNGASVYGDSTWRSSASRLEDSGPFGYGLNNAGEVTDIAGYGVANRQPNRGIAA